nr:putative reverse transcriptase domain-containing protein [Tanacetum cinerariifolium]
KIILQEFQANTSASRFACEHYTYAYMNRADVQEAIHALQEKKALMTNEKSSLLEESDARALDYPDTGTGVESKVIHRDSPQSVNDQKGNERITFFEKARSLLSTKAPSNFKLFSNVVPMSSDTKKVGQNNMSPQWQKLDVLMVVLYLFLSRNAMRSRIPAAHDRQKSYADVSRKPLEFQVGDKVKLKISSWKEVIRFSKRGKLNSRYIGPFNVLAIVGAIAYKLKLSQQLSKVHSTFHESNLKKSLSDESLVIPLDEIQIDNKLHFVDEPVEILDREVK